MLSVRSLCIVLSSKCPNIVPFGTRLLDRWKRVFFRFLKFEIYLDSLTALDIGTSFLRYHDWLCPLTSISIMRFSANINRLLVACLISLGSLGAAASLYSDAIAIAGGGTPRSEESTRLQSPRIRSKNSTWQCFSENYRFPFSTLVSHQSITARR